MRAPQRTGPLVNVVRGALGQGGGWVIPQDGVGHAGCELECCHKDTKHTHICGLNGLGLEGLIDRVLTGRLSLCSEARAGLLWAQLHLA